jgi:hypothetical protein
MCACLPNIHTLEFKNTRSVVIPYLFVLVSAFAKSVEPQSSTYFQGLRQRYNLLTRWTPNQCASLRRDDHGSMNQLSSDKIGTELGLTDPSLLNPPRSTVTIPASPPPVLRRDSADSFSLWFLLSRTNLRGSVLISSESVQSLSPRHNQYRSTVVSCSRHRLRVDFVKEEVRLVIELELHDARPNRNFLVRG